ncbi:DUF2157 domain-containing protein [Hoeflea sp. AS60]|uniref:DUF2157 domain-containing protein n=1 Tax=Hoeflea sp. AS60 TaxID=3135780 RepID=UPI003179BAF8
MFRRYLAREIDQWTKAGLLKPGQGDVLLSDHDRRHTGFSLSSVLAVLAAVLLGAAVIALIAANWEGIARPARVLMIFVFIAGGLTAAALALRKNAYWILEAALVFTLLCYGAGIALVGQMYHLSGDETAFMLAWTIGALVVSLAFSSATAAISAGLLGIGYLIAESSLFGSGYADVFDISAYATALSVVVLIGVSAGRTRSIIAGHLCALMLVGWVMWVVDETTDVDPGYILAVTGAVAFAIGSKVPPAIANALERHGVVSAYGAVLFLGGVGLIQIDLVTTSLAAEMAFAGFILLVSVAILAIAGRENRLIRRFAYFAFACETIYVVGETLGSLLGSSGFLFLGGLVLAVIAFAVMKIEKRFKTVGEPS